MSRKLLFEIEEDILKLDDKRIDAFRKAYIDETDLMRMIRSDDPFEMVDGRLKFFTKIERQRMLDEYLKSQKKHLRTFGGMDPGDLRKIRDLILHVFPEAEDVFNEVEEEIKRDQCPDCILPFKYEKVANFLLSIPKGRDVSALEGHIPSLTLRLLKGDTLADGELEGVIVVPSYVRKIDIPFLDESKIVIEDFDPSLDNATRKACWDCVKKHLSEALVLMPECLMGYGADKHEQKWEMIGHLSQAAKECVKVNQPLADRIRSLRTKIMKQGPVL